MTNAKIVAAFFAGAILSALFFAREERLRDLTEADYALHRDYLSQLLASCEAGTSVSPGDIVVGDPALTAEDAIKGHFSLLTVERDSKGHYVRSRYRSSSVGFLRLW